MTKIAVLDDYQGVAEALADWTPVESRAEVAVFTDHVEGEDAVVARLTPFDVVCVMRERTPITRGVIERLPNLKLIVSTGRRNAAVDSVAAAEKNVLVGFTGYSSTPTIEHTWALIFGLVRHIAAEANAVRAGGWQHTVGENLGGKTLALLGLGNIGSEVAKIARVLGMNVIAWSQNLTADKAKENGAELVTKETLFARADILSIHLVLSARSRGLVLRRPARVDEADRLSREHVTWPDRRRGGARRSAEKVIDRGGRGRCVRARATAARSSFPHARPSPRHAAHRLRDEGALSNVLRRHREADRPVPRGKAAAHVLDRPPPVTRRTGHARGPRRGKPRLWG